MGNALTGNESNLVKSFMEFKGGAFASATPQPHPDHLLLGVNMWGLVFCAECMGWGFDWEEEVFINPAPEVYTRDESKLGWITEQYGPELIGYDFAVLIRQWLSKNKFEAFSPAELMLAGGFDGGSGEEPEVGDATVFISHIQAEKLDRLPYYFYMCNWMFDFRNCYWLDFLCLRQCHHDFDLTSMTRAISKIGFTCVCLPENPQHYLDRAFCIFEVASTLRAGKEVGVVWLPKDMDLGGITEEYIDQNFTVDVKTAQTRDKDDKDKIDVYVDEVGEDYMNSEVLKAIKRDVLTMEERLPD